MPTILSTSYAPSFRAGFKAGVAAERTSEPYSATVKAAKWAVRVEADHVQHYLYLVGFNAAICGDAPYPVDTILDIATRVPAPRDGAI